MNTPAKFTALAAAAVALMGTAGLARAADYATVISATPVTGQVNVPRQQCADVDRQVVRQPSGGGALVGAIVGGVLGNTIGHGAGRVAATGLGAVAGAAVGNNVESNGNGGYAQTVRDCRTVGSYESRVIGYDVVYEYHGQRYTTRTATDPGPRLAIDVRPAGAPLDNVGPRGGYDAAPAYGQPPASYGQPVPAYDYDAGPAYAPPPPPAYYYRPAPVYYGPAPVYYGPPVIGIGFSTGWHRGYRHW